MVHVFLLVSVSQHSIKHTRQTISTSCSLKNVSDVYFDFLLRPLSHPLMVMGQGYDLYCSQPPGGNPNDLALILGKLSYCPSLYITLSDTNIQYLFARFILPANICSLCRLFKILVDALGPNHFHGVPGLPWSSALVPYLFTIFNPFLSQSVFWPCVCDRAHPATRVELLMPGEAERWFHCVFRCGDGWLSEAARGVLGRRASVENKYTLLLLMHRATLAEMQMERSPLPNCLQYYSPIPTWIPSSQTLSHRTLFLLSCGLSS